VCLMASSQTGNPRDSPHLSSGESRGLNATGSLLTDHLSAVQSVRDLEAKNHLPSGKDDPATRMQPCVPAEGIPIASAKQITGSDVTSSC
jgi:hypothetical protein